MQPAAHEGPHAIVVEWGDEECWTPDSQNPLASDLIAAAEYGIPFPTRAALVSSHADECLVCDHPMHKRMCPEESCDCKAGIPK